MFKYLYINCLYSQEEAFVPIFQCITNLTLNISLFGVLSTSVQHRDVYPFGISVRQPHSIRKLSIFAIVIRYDLKEGTQVPFFIAQWFQ